MSHHILTSGRLLIYLLATFGTCIIGTLFSSFNFGWVCMVNATASDPTQEDEYGGSLTWDQDVQKLLFSSYSIGAILASIPVGIMVNRYGTRSVFTGCAILGGVASLLTPIAATYSFIIVACLRIIIGISCCSYWPVTFAVCTHWAPKVEIGIALAIVSSGFQIGQFVGILFAGLECTYIGWRWIFYITGIASIGFAVLWCIIYRDSSADHFCISSAESKYIEDTRSKKMAENSKTSVPWFKIFTSLPVWASMICCFLATYISYTVNTFAPTYLKETSNLSPLINGYLSSLPLLFQLFGRLSSGYLSDKLTCFGPTIRLKVFNTFAFFGSAIFSLGLTFVTASTPVVVSVVCFCGTMFTIIYCTGGYVKAPLLLSPQYSAVIGSLMNIAGCAGAIVMPIVVSSLVPMWNIIFYISVGSGLAGSLIFLIFASGKQQNWSKYHPQNNDIETTLQKVSMSVITRF